MKVVALGGGHGLSASLQALRQVTHELTAVVTVADDGGSSGRLRRELDVLPPGDLRMALAALAGEDAWSQTWAQLLQHRFPGEGQLAGHAVGNLLLTGLTQTAGGCLEALDTVGRLVGAVGRVLPASTQPLDVAADVEDGDGLREVVGQVAVATVTGRVRALRLRPAEPAACAEAVAAVRAADWVVLGPGSWFTSVLTHLLVPGLRRALVETAARRLVVLNMSAQAGETEGFSPEAHLEVLRAHAPDLRVDVVLADETSVADPRALLDACSALGAELVLAPVARGDGTPRHHPDRLATACRAVFTSTDTSHDTPTGAPAWR